MHNIFITQYFDWPPIQPSKKVQFINKILEKLGFWARLAPPVRTGLMTNVEQRINMYHLARQVLVYGVPGDFVELGCHAGQSAVLLQKIIEYYDPSRTLQVYDSFQGLPKLSAKDGDTPFYKGQLTTTREQLYENFKIVGVKPPVVHEGWFSDTLPTQLPDAISFAHLDGDLYDSIMVSLKHTYPRLSRGAVCLIDDYCDPSVYDGWNKLPGVKRACDEFLADKKEKVSVLYAAGFSHGFFCKE